MGCSRNMNHVMKMLKNAFRVSEISLGRELKNRSQTFYVCVSSLASLNYYLLPVWLSVLGLPMHWDAFLKYIKFNF